MPKHVDHEQRRRQIADALLRVAAARGLHNAGMREVAAEARMSVRLIQYYFGTKEQLLLYTTQYLAARLGERVLARIKAANDPSNPRAVIEAILAEALPDDEESRVFTVVYTSYLALSLTDPAFDIRPLGGNSDAVIGAVAAQLRAARDVGRLAAGVDAGLEATSLLALSAGLGTSVLAGQRSADGALTVIRYHLDRLLPTYYRSQTSASRSDLAVTARRAAPCVPVRAVGGYANLDARRRTDPRSLGAGGRGRGRRDHFPSPTP